MWVISSTVAGGSVTRDGRLLGPAGATGWLAALLARGFR